MTSTMRHDQVHFYGCGHIGSGIVSTECGSAQCLVISPLKKDGRASGTSEIRDGKEKKTLMG